MSAIGVSRACYDKYEPIQQLPLSLRGDIDQLAGHFFANGQFESLFINQLVPWDELAGEPNAGHAAVADLLLCGAASAALSANFDMMIEQWSSHRKVALRGALDGREAVQFASVSRPLLKFHGCMMREREETLWTRAQLATPKISTRIDNCKAWMNLHLHNRDLLIVGFWTDWGYLNSVLASALAGSKSSSITVIDPSTTADLQLKAPALWATLSASSSFEHVQASSDAALSEVRAAFSQVWTRKLYALGRSLYSADKDGCPASLLTDPSLDVEVLYDLRRDAEGIAANRAARQWQPDPSAAQTGYAHLLLASKATGRTGAWYDVGGETVRVVHGAGEGLTTVQERFNEPPSAPTPSVVVCVGALDQGVPGNIISNGRGASVVRPKLGGGSRWISLDQARVEFDL